jgi:CBS domain-containing protein
MVTVHDLMQTDLVTVPPEMTARELARTLTDQGISGVPVVSDSGALLGVASATDLVRLAAEDVTILAAAVPRQRGDPEDDAEDDLVVDAFFQDVGPADATPWDLDSLDDGPLDQLTVSDVMTPISFSVEPTASARELADFLVRGRIHRAVVLEDGRLRGIVTTMDILRAVADGRI